MTTYGPCGCVSIFIVVQKFRFVLLLTPNAISTTCLNSRTWESNSGREGGGGVTCHFAIPASMSQTLFPLGIQ